MVKAASEGGVKKKVKKRGQNPEYRDITDRDVNTVSFRSTESPAHVIGIFVERARAINEIETGASPVE